MFLHCNIFYSSAVYFQIICILLDYCTNHNINVVKRTYFGDKLTFYCEVVTESIVKMSTMVMCPDQPPASGMFQRYPSPPVSYPFGSFGYNGSATQHPQDYNQFQVPEHGVQQAWYNAMYGTRTDDWAYGPTASGAMTSTPTGMGAYSYRSSQMGVDYSQPQGQVTSESPCDTSSSSSSSGSPSNKQLRPPYDWMKKASYQSAPVSGKCHVKLLIKVHGWNEHQMMSYYNKTSILNF